MRSPTVVPGRPFHGMPAARRAGARRGGRTAGRTGTARRCGRTACRPGRRRARRARRCAPRRRRRSSRRPRRARSARTGAGDARPGRGWPASPSARASDRGVGVGVAGDAEQEVDVAPLGRARPAGGARAGRSRWGRWTTTRAQAGRQVVGGPLGGPGEEVALVVPLPGEQPGDLGGDPGRLVTAGRAGQRGQRRRARRCAARGTGRAGRRRSTGGG